MLLVKFVDDEMVGRLLTADDVVDVGVITRSVVVENDVVADGDMVVTKMGETKEISHS